MVGLLAISLCGCSEALNCLSGNCISNNDASDDGTLSNGAKVYIDKNLLSISPESTDTFTVTVKGGTTNEDFLISFGTPEIDLSVGKQLQKQGLTNSTGITLSPSSCLLNNYDKTSCKVTISMSDEALPATYRVKPTAVSVKSSDKKITLTPLRILANRNTSDDSKLITSYFTPKIDDNSGVIDFDINEDESKITVRLPHKYESQLTNLAVSYTTTGSRVEVNGVVQTPANGHLDFSSGHQTYKVFAKNGSSRLYDVFVTAAPNDAKYMLTYTAGNIESKPDDNNEVNITLHSGDITKLPVEFTIDGDHAKMEIGGKLVDAIPDTVSDHDFTKPVKYVVYAQNGESNTYWVNIKVEPTTGDWRYTNDNPKASIGTGTFASLAIAPSGTKYMAYQDNDSAKVHELVVMYYTGATWESLGRTGFKDASNITIALDTNEIPYVVFKDNTPRGHLIKYDKPTKTWAELGIESGFNSGFAAIGGSMNHTNLMMEINPVNNNLYVAYATTGSTLAVKSFDEANKIWNDLNIKVNSTSINYPRLTFNSKGELFVAFVDNDNGHNIKVKKLLNENNKSWSADSIVANIDSSYPSLEINPVTDTPYIALQNQTNLKTNVYKATDDTANSWVPVGDQDLISVQFATNQSLVFDALGRAYVGFQDPSIGTTVMYYNGVSWNNLGNKGFSNGATNGFINLAMTPSKDTNGKVIPQTPYIAFVDETNNYVSVMYYTKPLP